MVYDIVPTIRALSDCCSVNMVGGVHSQCHRQNSSVWGAREGGKERGRKGGRNMEGGEEGERREGGGREGRRERKEETLHTCPTVLQSMTARDFPLTFAYLLAASEPHGRVIEG